MFVSSGCARAADCGGQGPWSLTKVRVFSDQTRELGILFRQAAWTRRPVDGRFRAAHVRTGAALERLVSALLDLIGDAGRLRVRLWLRSGRWRAGGLEEVQDLDRVTCEHRVVEALDAWGLPIQP